MLNQSKNILRKTSLSMRYMSTGKDVKFGNSARNRMAKGVNVLADAVSVTLGPKGRNALIDQPYGSPKITKDGVTVAKSIEFKDHFENMGAQLVRQVANKTNEAAGDGTTTATVLSRAIFSEGCKSVAAGLNPMDLRRGITMAVNHIVDNLATLSKQIEGKEEISQVGTISANNEKSIGELIANAMEKVGNDGIISVQNGTTMYDELEIVEGMKFDRGYISPYFATETKRNTCVMEKPLILMYEKKISSMQSLLPVLESVVKTQQPLLIIAEDIDGEALATLVLNKLRSNLKICAVKAPGFGEQRKAALQDLAVLTGGQVISEDTGASLDKVTLDMLGRCNKATITKDDTMILDGEGEKDMISERCNLLKDQIGRTKSEYEKEKLQERLAKLGGGVAVVKVGGSSDVEVGEKKDRITDALNATRAAVAEGIVPGGGTALIRASAGLDDLKSKCENFDQEHGIDIIKKAVRVPCYTIAENAGVEGSVVVGKLLESSDDKEGYNAYTNTYMNMIDAGIIDPTKVVRTALLDAASVAGLMITTESMIADLPPKSESNEVDMGGYPGNDMGMF